MPEGSAGAVYLDLIVRDTIAQQVGALSEKLKGQMQKAMASAGKASADALNKVAANAGKAANAAAASTAGALGKMESSLAKAKAKLEGYHQELQEIQQSTDEMLRHASTGEQVDNVLAIEQTQVDQLNEKYAAQLAAVEKVTAKLEEQRQKVAALQEATAQKTAAVQEQTAQKASAAVNQARASEGTAAQRAAVAAASAAQKTAAVQAAAAKQAEEAHRKAAESTRKKWKSTLSTLGKGLTAPLAAAAGKIGGIFKKNFDSAGKSASRFGTRLKGILSGALVFNGISAGLRNLTQYFSSAIGQSTQMQSALANLKGAAATAAAPLIQILTPALSALANAAAQVFAAIAQVVSLLTGKSVASMASAAKGMQSAGNAAGGAAKQMEKARRTLAGFDEIERLDAPDSDAGGSGGGGGAGANFDAALDPAPVSEKLAGIFQVFENAWKNQGQKTIAAIKSALDSVKALAGSIGDSFYTVFTNGTGQRTLETILRIFQNIMGCVDKFAERLKVAWDDNGNGTAIIQAWWDGLNAILTMFDRMSGATVVWLNELDLSPVLGSFSQYMSSIESLVGLITGALADAYETVLLPLASWTIEEAAPACIDLLTAAMAALRDILDPVWQGLQKVLDQLRPVADFIGGVVIDCLNGLKSIFEKVSQVFQEKGEKIQEIMDGVGTVIATVWETVEPIFLLLKDIVGDVFTFIGNLISNEVSAAIDALHGFVEFIAGVFTGDWNRAWNGIQEIFSAIWDRITGVAAAVREFLNSIWNRIKDDVTSIFNRIFGFLSNIWNGIKGTVLNAVTAIKTGISTGFNAVKDTVSRVFNNIKTISSNIWNGIVSTIKGAINGIIGGINGMISGIVEGINAVIRALNKLHFDIPGWVPVLGGKSFGFNIPTLTAPQIPLLAKGGVIKQPTLAMMGEYPGAGSNPEIAAPQSVIAEAVANANGDVVAAILQVAKEIIDAIRENRGIVIGDEVIGRAADRYYQRQAVVNGGLV